jgi:ribonuclease-3
MLTFIFRNKMKGNAPQLEKRIKYHFKDKELLLRSLTHSSYAYENQEKPQDNELLEFLGDSVVGLIAADFFFRMYPDTTEGELSKFKSSASSTVALADYARQIKLDAFMRLGKGEEKSGGRKKSTILAGLFEALVGALFVDGGFAAARDFYEPLLEGSYKKIRSQGFEINNYKSALQEFLQKEDLPAPQYKTVTSHGPDHRREFVIEVLVNKTALASAKGPSRKVAEQKAAEKALKSFFGKRIKALTPETFIFNK